VALFAPAIVVSLHDHMEKGQWSFPLVIQAAGHVPMMNDGLIGANQLRLILDSMTLMLQT